MRMKFPDNIRAEFREFLKDMGSLKEAGAYLGIDWRYLAVMKSRGYMSKGPAATAEEKSGGKYWAVGLVKKKVR